MMKATMAIRAKKPRTTKKIMIPLLMPAKIVLIITCPPYYFLGIGV